jgi:hypothetical protein
VRIELGLRSIRCPSSIVFTTSLTYPLRVYYPLRSTLFLSYPPFSVRIFAMTWLAKFVLLAHLLSSTLASPVPTARISPDDAALTKRDWNVQDLNDEFKGI